jgi:hypothetical protein
MMPVLFVLEDGPRSGADVRAIDGVRRAEDLGDPAEVVMLVVGHQMQAVPKFGACHLFFPVLFRWDH